MLWETWLIGYVSMIRRSAVNVWVHRCFLKGNASVFAHLTYHIHTATADQLSSSIHYTKCQNLITGINGIKLHCKRGLSKKFFWCRTLSLSEVCQTTWIHSTPANGAVLKTCRGARAGSCHGAPSPTPRASTRSYLLTKAAQAGRCCGPERCLLCDLFVCFFRTTHLFRLEVLYIPLLSNRVYGGRWDGKGERRSRRHFKNWQGHWRWMALLTMKVDVQLPYSQGWRGSESGPEVRFKVVVGKPTPWRVAEPARVPGSVHSCTSAPKQCLAPSRRLVRIQELQRPESWKAVLELGAGEPKQPLLEQGHPLWNSSSKTKPERGWELVTTQKPLEQRNADHSIVEGH